MTTQREIEEFAAASLRRELRRFLAEPVAPTGFDVPMDFATKHGREQLVQIRDFDQEAA